MSTCSVIMVTHHTGPMLFAAIKSIMRQPRLAELILVDNGNPPDVFSRLQQMSLSDQRIKVIHGQGNIGYAKACNLAANQATGDFLLMLNPDCLLPPDALSNLMKSMDAPEIMLAAPMLLEPNAKTPRKGQRLLLTPKMALREVLGINRVRDIFGRPETAPEQTHEVDGVSSACMCIRASDFQRFAGFDDRYFLYVEDFDLCMRVHKTGGKIICVPRIKVTRMCHRAGEEKSSLEWYKSRGYIHYFNKHFNGLYFPGFLFLVNAGIMVRFAVKSFILGLQRSLKHQPILKQTEASRRLMILASGLAELPENKEFAGKTVLVTGATGQVGLCVIRRLIASGAAVLALSRAEGVPFEHPQLRWLKGDLADPKLELGGYFIDIVVHCAPLWFLPPAIDLLAEAEVKRIVAFGSTSIFARAMSHNSYDKNIVEKFANSEAEIAQRCEVKKIQWTIFRPTLIYGVGLDKNVTTLVKFIDRFSWFPVYPPAFGRRQPVHADDLAIGVLQVIAKENTYLKSYNLSGGEILTYREMLERIFKLLGKKTNIRPTTLMPFMLDMLGKLTGKPHMNGEVARRMNDDLVFFHDEARRDFGFSPRGFLVGGIRDIEGF